MTKTGVVYNCCYGGFSLSKEAILRGRELSGNLKWGDCVLPGEEYENGQVCNFFYGGIAGVGRHDSILVEIFHEIGSERMSGEGAELEFKSLPKGTPYRIDEYDGMETVEQPDEINWTTV